MAAQPSFWGTTVDHEGTASGQPRVRRETYSPGRQRYHQTPLTEERRSNLPADLFPEVLVESWLNPGAATIDEAPAVAENVEPDPLPRIRVAIDKLLSPNEDDGDPAATERAYQSARAVVESAYGRLFASIEMQAKQLPRHRIQALYSLSRTRIPIVTTDERGGVRLSWQHEGRYVRANFAAAEGLRSYLYFESPEEHDVEALQPETLSTRLDWMLKA
jgi:hypothetical protein